ncbi:hypothetical protein ACI65C_000107 [Semiaphis heraclei]
MNTIASISTTQSSQFKELNNSISRLSSKVAVLVAENTSLRAEVSVLRLRIDHLESRPVLSSDSSAIIARESTERSKIEFNDITYGVPESAANNVSLGFKDDLITLFNHLKNYLYQHSLILAYSPRQWCDRNERTSNCSRGGCSLIPVKKKLRPTLIITPYGHMTLVGMFLSPHPS